MDKAERVLAECKKRGLGVAKVGRVWHISGEGIDVRVLYLEHVDIAELDRRHPGPRTAWREAR